MLVQQNFLVTLGLTCLIGCAWSYGSGGQPSIYEAVSYLDNSVANGGYDAGGAQPSVVKISSDNWSALQQYGYQIGKPLLVKDYGRLTNLFSALAPKRSFVGVIDSGFYKDCYGNIKFRDESSVGALAV